MRKLQVFLSSAMTGDLDKERELIRFLFKSDNTLKEFYDLYAIEEHSCPREIEVAFCSEVESSDILIFVFNNQLRDAVLKEYETARKSNKITFIYLKHSENKEDGLRTFILGEIYKYNPGSYYDPQELCVKIKNDFIEDLRRNYINRIEINGEKENNVFSSSRTLTPNSVYRYFCADELLKIFNDTQIGKLSSEQFISLSGELVETYGNFKMALALLEYALIKDPQNWILYNNRGLILETMGLDEAALFSYLKVIEFNGNNETISYNLGMIYNRLADFKEAIKYYKLALEFNSKKENAVTNIAVCFLKLKDQIESLNWAKKAYDLNPNEITTINLIYAFTINEDFSAAHDLLGEIDKTTYTYQNVKSYILYKKEDYVSVTKLIDEMYENGYLEQEGVERKLFSLISMGNELESFNGLKKLKRVILLLPTIIIISDINMLKN
jgi:Flp pilus assembly protein TadD